MNEGNVTSASIKGRVRKRDLSELKKSISLGSAEFDVGVLKVASP